MAVMGNANSTSTSHDYVPLIPYNGTGSAGGDSLHDNLNLYYESGDVAWLITATALVLLMIPGVGSVGRLRHRQNADK